MGYPIIALFFSNDDMGLYNHLLYFFQTLLPSPTALIVGWAATGVIMNLVIGITFLFVFGIGAIFLLYIASETLWMTKIREMW